MGQWDLMLSLSLSLSLFHCVSLVPPTFLSLNLSLSSLFTPFPCLPLPHWTISLLQGYREQKPTTAAAEPLGRSAQAFSISARSCPGSIADCWSTRCRGCYVCLSSRILFQPWPNRALSCPTARRRGIREGRRHVGTDSQGALHWSLLL